MRGKLIRTAALVVGLCAAVALRSAAQEPAKPPTTAPKVVAVPAQADQAKALKLVRDVFADDYKKKSSKDRVALAGRLLKQASEPGNDAASRYVMLREARDVALAAGDVGLALSAVDGMADAFVVDATALKTELLTAAAKKPAGAPAAEAIAGGFFELSEQALADADVERAARMIAQAESLARKSKNAELAGEYARRKKEVREFTSKFGPLPPVKEKLKTAPDDPAANLALGKFYCFGVGNWLTGLPMLAKGNDPALQKLARADLAGADKPEAKVSVGDGWFDHAEKSLGAVKDPLRARAAHWYEQALPTLQGLERTRVEKRIAAIAASAAASGFAPKPKDKAIRLLEALVAHLPADARPTREPLWDDFRAGRLLTTKAENTPVDVEVTVYYFDANRLDGRDFGFARFEHRGTVEMDGVLYGMEFMLNARENVAPESLVNLRRGARVRLRGVVRRIGCIGWSDGSGFGTNRVRFEVEVGKPNITLLSEKAVTK